MHDPHAHGHGDHGRTGALIMVGDTVHNFVDGVLIAAAFLQSTELGVIAALAIIAHEIPQEVGDFLILLHSGYTRGPRILAGNYPEAAPAVPGPVMELKVWMPAGGGACAPHSEKAQAGVPVPDKSSGVQIHTTILEKEKGG